MSPESYASRRLGDGANPSTQLYIDKLDVSHRVYLIDADFDILSIRYAIFDMLAPSQRAINALNLMAINALNLMKGQT
jgi:hypothetical protein